MAPFELADLSVGSSPVQFPSLHAFGRIHKHRAVQDGGYKGSRIGDFRWISNCLTKGGDSKCTRKPNKQGAERIKVEQA